MPALGHKTQLINHRDAKCTETGYTGDEVCTVCGETVRAGSVIPAAGHMTELRNHRDASCTKAGYTGDTYCVICGELTGRGQTIPAMGHSWGDWVVTTPATEDDEGVRTRTCVRCGESEEQVIPVLAHTHALTAFEKVEATCTTDGTEAYWACSKCGKLYSDAEATNEIAAPITIPAPGHDYQDVVTAPTCTEQGYTTHTCSRCGDSYVDTYVEAHGHKTEVHNHKDATCTKPGYTGDEICSVCGNLVNQGKMIPATGHTPELRDTKDPTCTETGYTGDTYCSECGELIGRGQTIPALGHDWDAGAVTKEPTCEADGIKTFTCRHDASHTRTEAIPALGHDYKSVVTEPTCTEKGYTTYTCSRCGDSYVGDEVSALGHDWGEWEVVTEPTQFEPGLRQRVCKHDPTHIETEEIPATGVCDGGENCPSRKFVDVDHSPDCWYHAPVDWAVVNGITAGINDDHFDPNGKCTRSQAVTFLWRAMGKPEPTSTDNPFSDVSESAWYYQPVLWAVENGITAGVGGGRFDPDGTCIRSQIVTFLYRCMK